MHAQLVDRSGSSSTDRHRCMQTLMGNSPQPCAPARSGATLPLINQHPRWRVRQSNPHSASRTLTVPIPRFPPLAVCVRRPSVNVAPSSWPASANVHTICRSVGVERTADKPLVAAGLVQRRERGMCAVCHECRRSTRRCGTVREMKEGPSGSAVRCWPQAAASCDCQKQWW